MSKTKEVPLTSTPRTQSGNLVLQEERDPRPVSHTASFSIPRRPPGGGPGRDGSGETHDPVVQPQSAQTHASAVRNFAVPRRPQTPETPLSIVEESLALDERATLRVAAPETPLPEVAQEQELDEITAKRIAVPKTPILEVAQEQELDVPTAGSDDAPQAPRLIGSASSLAADTRPDDAVPVSSALSARVAVRPLVEAPAARVVRNFAVPRRPQAPGPVAPETPLPMGAEDLALDERVTLRIAAPETPRPQAGVQARLVGSASALVAHECPDDAGPVSSAHLAVAAQLVREQETFPAGSAYHLCVVVPVGTQRQSVRPMLLSLRNALRGMRVEVILVDERDDTSVELEDAARALGTPWFHVHAERRGVAQERTGGPAPAVVPGMNWAQAEYVAFIDADLRHPPEQVREMYDQARAQDADVVVASRSMRGGSDQGGRRFNAVALRWAARLLFPGHVLRVSDPLSGFFLVRRQLVAGVALPPVGYDILLEVLVRCPWQQALEVPARLRAGAGGPGGPVARGSLPALAYMARLWRDVPAAGRSWKIVLLLLLNVLVTAILLTVGEALPTIWSGLNVVVFALMGCLDFVLCNRFIFPSPAGNAGSAGNVGSERVASEEREITAKRRAVRLSAATPPHTHHTPHTAHVDGQRVHSTDQMETLQPASSGLYRAVPRGQSGALETPRRDLLRERVQRGAAIAVVLLTVGWIIYRQPGAPLVLAVLLMGLPLALVKSGNRDQAITMTLALAVAVATLDYVSWRLTATNWSAWWISVPLLCAEVFGALHVLGFQYTVWPWSPPPESAQGEDDPSRLPIFIFIPTANEGPSILEPTLRGSIAAREKYLARYPHGRVSIVVCNDGRVAKAANWEAIETLAERLGVACVTRSRGGGAKAGNIEHARKVLGATGDALLVIFDADQIAAPEFLLKTIPHFRDPQLGWVQSGQYYANLDNPVSRWADDQQSMFYNLLCPGKAASNAAFICGTNVVIRACALDQIGGLPQDSVTEDFAASIALHPSWRSIYLTDILATGLGPLDVPSYLKQQGRWALGTLSVFRSHWRDILLPRKRGLQLGQRVQYFLACTHYLCGLRDLIYLLSPLVFILTGIPAVRSAYLSEYLWHFLPYAGLSAASLWYAARGVTGLRGIIIGFGSFPVLIASTLSALAGRKVSFAVTAKQRDGKRSLGYLGVYCFFFLLCCASLLWATQLRGRQQTPLFISLLWVVYSLLMLGSFLWLNLRDLRFHASAQRSGAPAVTVANQPYASTLLKRGGGLNPLWNLGLAALLAAPILAGSAASSLALFSGGQANPFVIGDQAIAAPYLGLTLPVQLLADRPPVLGRELGAQFSIIGRTQDLLGDHFDSSWANQLAAHGARPWITLQFGVFGPDQRPPLDANLPAIINGVDDGAITRWAKDIRAYGKPVYLTILQHADRNWSLSSGVANGGIPQDVPAAWVHVQSIFRANGAVNVAWVWAPADPLNDQAFAPPASTINAVLQSFIHYPGTPWGDPETVLQGLVGRYPSKPIFVEASVAGPSEQKAEWLTRLGLAVEGIPHVYALLYHEGGPGLAPNSAQIQSWSFASDPASLAAMRQIVQDLASRRSSSAFSCSASGQVSAGGSIAGQQGCFK